MPASRKTQAPAVPAPVLRTPGRKQGPKSQRTIQRILDNARTLFLDRGYQGTAVEDITSAAGVSRATFWTYFASKQDVLRALGSDAEGVGQQLSKDFAKLPQGASLAEVTDWVRGYMGFLDEYGAFIHTAFQAAYSDPELRRWGIDTEMAGARTLGRGLAHLRGGKSPAGVDPAIEGLAVLSMLEQFWYKWRMGDDSLPEDDVVKSLGHLIWGTARQ